MDCFSETQAKLLDFIVDNNFEANQPNKHDVNKIIEKNGVSPLAASVEKHQNLSDSLRGSHFRKREEKANEKISQSIEVIKNKIREESFYDSLTQGSTENDSRNIESSLGDILARQNKLLKILMSEEAFKSETG